MNLPFICSAGLLRSCFLKRWVSGLQRAPLVWEGSLKGPYHHQHLLLPQTLLITIITTNPYTPWKYKRTKRAATSKLSKKFSFMDVEVNACDHWIRSFVYNFGSARPPPSVPSLPQTAMAQLPAVLQLISSSLQPGLWAFCLSSWRLPIEAVVWLPLAQVCAGDSCPTG